MADIVLINEYLFDPFEVQDAKAVSLGELETRIEYSLHQAARDKLENMVKTLEEQNPALTSRCRRCGGHAHYVSNRRGFLRTRFGIIRYRRAQYDCPQCHQSTYPLDERLDPYASLARLRVQIAAGNNLPVDEMACAWGLGTLKVELLVLPEIIPPNRLKVWVKDS